MPDGRDTRTGRVEGALAGHAVPLAGTVRWDRPATVGARQRAARTGRPGAYPSQEHTLEPGTVLALYADGLHEPGNDDVRSRPAVGRPSPGGDLDHLADRLLKGAAARSDGSALLPARYGGGADGTERQAVRLPVRRRNPRGVRAARHFVHERLSA